MLKFNVNSHVLVRLTASGKEHWKKHYNKYYEMPPKTQQKYPFEEHYARKTSNRLRPGYSEFQMHEFMEIFGDGCVSSHHFDTNILMYTEDLGRAEKIT